MKINLLLDNPGGVRSGYVNVDPFNPEATRCPPDDLTPVCDANEATELVALDVLGVYPAFQADEVLDHWLSRLAHGGVIAVSAVDMREVARAVLDGRLSFDEANELLHGRQDHEARVRRSTYTVGRLAQVLETKGLEVVRKRVENYRAVVVARRP